MASQLQILAGTVVDDATVGTVAWTNPDNAKVSDDVYATNTPTDQGISHYLKASNFGFSIPSGATINGILVEFERKANVASGIQNIKDKYIKIVKADGTIGTTDKADTVTLWSTTEAYSSYGSSSDLWGETWDDAKINDIDFGVVLSVTAIDDTVPNPIASVDHIRITVYYTEATTGRLTATGRLTSSTRLVATGRLTATGRLNV